MVRIHRKQEAIVIDDDNDDDGIIVIDDDEIMDVDLYKGGAEKEAIARQEVHEVVMIDDDDDEEDSNGFVIEARNRLEQDNVPLLSLEEAKSHVTRYSIDVESEEEELGEEDTSTGQRKVKQSFPHHGGEADNPIDFIDLDSDDDDDVSDASSEASDDVEYVGQGTTTQSIVSDSARPRINLEDQLGPRPCPDTVRGYRREEGRHITLATLLIEESDDLGISYDITEYNKLDRKARMDGHSAYEFLKTIMTHYPAPRQSTQLNLDDQMGLWGLPARSQRITFDSRFFRKVRLEDGNSQRVSPYEPEGTRLRKEINA